MVICEIWLFALLFPQYYKSEISNVEVRISRSVLEGPFDFEIMRVDCIHLSLQGNKQGTNYTLEYRATRP